MKYLNLPFFDELEKTNSILLAGASGGYDIFTGLPLYLGLPAAGKQVHLANLSFSFLPPIKTQQLSPDLLKVTADTPHFEQFYFPEFHLSQWFQEQQNEEIPIYCFNKTGVKPPLKIYQTLVDYLSKDSFILIFKRTKVP
jgi:hypothetical protein